MIFKNSISKNIFRLCCTALVFAVFCGFQARAQTIPVAFYRNQMNTVVLTSGTSWTVPSGVTNLITVECWGAGGLPGGGAGASGGSVGYYGAIAGSGAGGQIILTYRR